MSGLVITSPATDRFTQLLSAYLALNTRNAGQLVAKRAKDVSIRLYQETVKHSPKRADIARKVVSLGWRVKRKKGKWHLDKDKGEKKGSRGPLRRMQAAQISKRAKAIGYVASGWLPAVKKFGGTAGKRLVQVKNPRGTVTITGIDAGSPTIIIANQTPGVVKMQQKHNIVRSAFNGSSRDMAVYIRRKLEEQAQQLRR